MLLKFCTVASCLSIFVQAATPGYHTCTTCIWTECPQQCDEVKKEGFFSKLKGLFKSKPKENEATMSECYSCGDACAPECPQYTASYATPAQQTQPVYYQQAPSAYYQQPSYYANQQYPNTPAMPYTPQCSNYCYTASCTQCPPKTAIKKMKSSKPPKTPKRTTRDVRCKQDECRTCDIEEITEVRKTIKRSGTKCSHY